MFTGGSAKISFLPVFMWLSVAAMFFVFMFNALHARFIYDDLFFLDAASRLSFSDAVAHSNNVYNRWLSNVINPFVFLIFGARVSLYWIIHLLQLCFFVMAFTVFFRSVFGHFFRVDLSWKRSAKYALFFTSAFYWAFFDARIELWHWQSSSVVYLYSIILLGCLFGVIYDCKISVIVKYTCAVIIAFLIGGLSETSAVSILLVCACLGFTGKGQYRMLPLVACLAILGSLLITVLSPGASLRSNVLPEPELLSGIKNGFYTVLLQLKKVKHLPFKALSVFLLFLMAVLMRAENPSLGSFKKLNVSAFVIIGAVIGINLFVPAYFISQETPDRALAIIYLLMLLAGLHFFLRKNLAGKI